MGLPSAARIPANSDWRPKRRCKHRTPSLLIGAIEVSRSIREAANCWQIAQIQRIPQVRRVIDVALGYVRQTTAAEIQTAHHPLSRRKCLIMERHAGRGGLYRGGAILPADASHPGLIASGWNYLPLALVSAGQLCSNAGSRSDDASAAHLSLNRFAALSRLACLADHHPGPFHSARKARAGRACSV